MKTAQASPKNIDAYIAGFPPDVQAILEQIRTAIQKAAADAEEAMKYRLPTFVQSENLVHVNLVHFGAFKSHIGFYPTPSGIEAFKDELSAYEGAKGSVQFPFDEPIPLRLISQIVKFRVKEIREKAANKKKK